MQHQSCFASRSVSVLALDAGPRGAPPHDDSSPHTQHLGSTGDNRAGSRWDGSKLSLRQVAVGLPRSVGVGRDGTSLQSITSNGEDLASLDRLALRGGTCKE